MSLNASIEQAARVAFEYKRDVTGIYLRCDCGQLTNLNYNNVPNLECWSCGKRMPMQPVNLETALSAGGEKVTRTIDDTKTVSDAQFIVRYQNAVGERDRLQAILDDVAYQLSQEGKSFEHLLATASIGKHTTVIGKARYHDLKNAIDAVWPLFDKHGPVTGSAPWNETWLKAEAALQKVVGGSPPPGSKGE